MPTYKFEKWSVTIGEGGKIKVIRGDSISGYCAAIYQVKPAATKKHWGEFARHGNNGKPQPLPDPNAIQAGETLIHMPSTVRAEDKQINVNLLGTKLARLRNVRLDGLKVYDRIQADIKKQIKDVDNFSFGLDMAAVVATAAGAAIGAARSAYTGAKAADQIAKDLVKRSWGFGIQPQKQGVVQGISQNIIGYGDNLATNETDSTGFAIFKIVVSSFIDLTSPSYWSKRLAGGDPKDTLKSALAQCEENRQSFLAKIDAAISQTQQELAAQKKLVPK